MNRTTTHKAYLLTGGNIGNRSGYLDKALVMIADTCGKITAISSIYETAAWGMENQQSFLNQAIEIETALSPENLLKELLLIEAGLGRIRVEKYGPRVIDIDILLYNNMVMHSQSLNLPHPELPKRRFALAPLQEIAPNLMHPESHRSITELLKDCKDPLDVHKIT